jgi:hypothetical protein
MSKTKDGWQDKSRLEKIAGAMYPNLLSPEDQRGMIAQNQEQRAGIERRISDGQRSYGVKPSPPLSIYDRVAGLKRVEVKATKSWWDK